MGTSVAVFGIGALLMLAICQYGTVHAETGQIPSWVQTIFKAYADGDITDAGLLHALQYLAEMGIIKLDGQAGESQNGGMEDRGDFRVVYEPNPNSRYDEEDTALWWLQNIRILEDDAEFLNANFKLPHDVNIVARECGELNAFYYPDVREIVICYELVDDLFETWYYFSEDETDAYYAGDFAYSVVDYFLMHEVAHAVLDIYDLPFTGLEENVADQFAALVLSYSQYEGSDDYGAGQKILQDVGIYYLYEIHYWEEIHPQLLEDSGQEWDFDIPYWGVHGLDIQRFYNIACYMYGADPEYNADIVDDELLPYERAATCEWEYYKIHDSWNRLLDGYVHEGAFMDSAT